MQKLITRYTLALVGDNRAGYGIPSISAGTRRGRHVNGAMIDLETKAREGQPGVGKVGGRFARGCPIKCTPRSHPRRRGCGWWCRSPCGLFSASASAFVRSKGVAVRASRAERRVAGEKAVGGKGCGRERRPRWNAKLYSRYVNNVA